MMSFGWRPNTNCYGANGSKATDAQVNAATNGQAGCASPTWFYVLLAAAVLGGLSAKNKRKTV